MGNVFKTDFLFATPTLLSGVGSVLDVTGSNVKFNDSNTPREADEMAIRADFGVIGQDIYEAIRNGSKIQ